MGILFINDFKVVFREPSFRLFFFIPFLLIFVVNVFLPYLCENYPIVRDYIPYVLMGASIQTSTMFGFIYSMIFIDEKDTQVARVYGVLPVSKTFHLIARLTIPFAVATLFTWMILQFQPFYELPFLANLLVAMLAALLAPFIAVGVAVVSRNKVEGMTWLKVFNTPVIVPLLAFFVAPAYQLFFGLIPTHWTFQTLNNVIEQTSFWGNWIIGLSYHLLLLALLLRLFVRRHYL